MSFFHITYIENATHAFDFSAIEFSKLSHIIYTMATVRKDGKLVFPGEFLSTTKDAPQEAHGVAVKLYETKCRYRNLKTMFAIQCDATFFLGMSNDILRRTIIDNILDIIRDLGFDGVLLYITTMATKTHTHVLSQFVDELMHMLKLMATLHEHGSDYIISMSIDNIIEKAALLDNDVIEKYVSFVEIRGYDIHGIWNKKATYHSNLFTTDDHGPKAVDDVVSFLIHNGLPSSKVVLGVPLYGHCFPNISTIGANNTNVPSASTYLDYKCIARMEHDYDDNYVSSCFYSPEVNALVSFDSKESIYTKIEYIKLLGLGGICTYDITCDAKGEDSMTDFIYDGFEGDIKKDNNILFYRTSQYTNIQNPVIG